MNHHQAIVLVVAAFNLALILLFPPYDSVALGRGGAQSFDAFYFAFDGHANRLLNSNLLLLELYWVLINASIGWLLLRGEPRPEPILSRRAAVTVMVAVNLVVVWLFPPFENYASTLRAGGTYFDGFYFLFGDKWQRRFFIPLLYMEVLWILINGAILWLLIRDQQPAVARNRRE
jgi:hypothetical protein